MARPIGSAEELERRRTRGVELLGEGESPATIARVLGVHVTSVHRWRRMSRAPGGLAAVPQPGPTPGLGDSQLQQLEALLLLGGKHHGWHNELWTAARVAVVIERQFGRRYHPEHVRKILKGRPNWSGQKPRREARATTRRSRGGRAMSCPASSARRSPARPTSPPSTRPASS